MEQDTIVKQTVVISNSYTSRKGLTYQELNTKAEEWRACDIIGYKIGARGKEVPVFDLPSDFTLVTTRYTSTEGCNLCGHYIEIVCYIRNDKEKYLMIVGSECVHNNYGRVIQKKIKEFKDNETRQKAKLFLVKFIEWANTQKAYTTPANSFEKERLTYISYKTKQIAIGMIEQFDTISVRKLSNFMKKHDKDLLVPATVQLDGAYTITNLKELIKAFDNKEITLKIGFGKYRDMLVKDVDPSYINWAKENQNGN